MRRSKCWFSLLALPRGKTRRVCDARSVSLAFRTYVYVQAKAVIVNRILLSFAGRQNLAYFGWILVSRYVCTQMYLLQF